MECNRCISLTFRELHSSIQQIFEFFNKYLSSYYMLSTTSDMGNITVNKTGKISVHSLEFTFQWERQVINKQMSNTYYMSRFPRIYSAK